MAGASKERTRRSEKDSIMQEDISTGHPSIRGAAQTQTGDISGRGMSVGILQAGPIDRGEEMTKAEAALVEAAVKWERKCVALRMDGRCGCLECELMRAVRRVLRERKKR